MNVLGYIRVSSEMQVEKDNSLRNQIHEIKKYSELNNLNLKRIFSDQGISGLKNNRNGLEQLMNLIKQEKIDYVIVYSLSRLGRKLGDIIKLINELERKKVGFISIKEGIKNEDIIGKLMINILGSINEFEVKILSERIRDVKQFKKKKMEVYCGKISFGLIRKNDKLNFNLREIEIIELMTKKRKEGLSYKKIADYLNENDILSKENKVWYGASVRGVLYNGILNQYLNG